MPSTGVDLKHQFRLRHRKEVSADTCTLHTFGQPNRRFNITCMVPLD